jgi:hypothetical protein
MSPRRRISEGDPVAPVAAIVSAGLHERDVYIAAALSSAPAFDHDGGDPMHFTYSAQEICDRVLAIADCMMTRKESPR